jgi:hypothetical protein
MVNMHQPLSCMPKRMYTDRQMCGNYCPINRQTKSDKYAMLTLEEIFDVVGHARVFSTLDL